MGITIFHYILDILKSLVILKGLEMAYLDLNLRLNPQGGIIELYFGIVAYYPTT